MPEYLYIEGQLNQNVPLFFENGCIAETHMSKLTSGEMKIQGQPPVESVRKESRAYMTRAELLAVFPSLGNQNQADGIYIDFTEPQVFGAMWGGPTSTLELRERLEPYMVGTHADRVSLVERSINEGLALHALSQSQLSQHPGLNPGLGLLVHPRDNGHYSISVYTEQVGTPQTVEEMIKFIKNNTAPITQDRREAVLDLLIGLREVFELVEVLGDIDPPVIHRDIKQSAILQNRQNGQFKLIDFNNSTVGEEVPNPENASVWGSPRSMAPEQVIVGMRPSPLTDRYGLTLMLAEILTFDYPQNRPIEKNATSNRVVHAAARNSETFVPDLAELIKMNLGLHMPQALAIEIALKNGANFSPGKRTHKATEILDLCIKIIQKRSTSGGEIYPIELPYQQNEL